MVPASSSMQDHYTLLAREEEREMIPLCLDEGVGTVVWSPLARGRLARAWTQHGRRRGPRPTGTTRICCIPRSRRRPTTPSSRRSTRSRTCTA